MADEPDPTIDARTANFRRRSALYAMAVNTAVVAALFLRQSDVGTNAAFLLAWVIGGNVAVIGVAMGSKAIEQFVISRSAK